MYSLALIIFVVSEKKAFEYFPIGSKYRNVHWMVLYKLYVFCSDMKFKMAATAGLSLTLDPMGKYSNAFFSETTNMIKAKLYMNVHWMVLYKIYVFCSGMKFKMATLMYSLALIIFVVSEKKAFEHFPIGSNVNLCPAMAAILDFRSA
jgi:hypothetical protein